MAETLLPELVLLLFGLGRHGLIRDFGFAPIGVDPIDSNLVMITIVAEDKVLRAEL